MSTKAEEARQQRGILFLAGAALVAVAAGVAVMSARTRRRPSAGVQFDELRSALARIHAHPERLAAAPHPTILRRVTGAVVAGVATVLARRFTERFADRIIHE